MDRIRFGRSVRVLRLRRHWRQEDLGRAASLSRSAVGRIERGEIGHADWADLVAVAEALGGQLGLDFRWRGADLDHLVDADHAAIVDALVRIYKQAGWEVAVEATFSEYGERGSIDVFAWHPPTGLVAVNEVKASIGDAGATLIGIDRKVRLAPAIARRLGWRCMGVSRFLVVREGSTARRRVAAHREMFRASFPLDGRAAVAAIQQPSGRAVAGILFLSPAQAKDVTRPTSGQSRVRRRAPCSAAAEGPSRSP